MTTSDQDQDRDAFEKYRIDSGLYWGEVDLAEAAWQAALAYERGKSGWRPIDQWDRKQPALFFQSESKSGLYALPARIVTEWSHSRHISHYMPLPALQPTATAGAGDTWG